MAKVTISQLLAKKARGERFAVVTVYDATFARIAADAGIDVLLVGDSLGNVLQGHDSTLPVTIDQMAYHVSCVARAATERLIVADLPFGAYSTPGQTLDNAAELMRAGAHMVKLEGGEWLLESVAMLTERGIPVCGHLGLTPQSVNLFGGYKVQGRSEEQAQRIQRDAQALVAAGASLLVLECVPRMLGSEISRALPIPVIGIGAGNGTDAQVLVMHDLLGLSAQAPKFVRNFMQGASSVQEAFSNYQRAVANGEFPAPEHSYE
jgi:3-methyl-2-oxobutanoate hydroxymethyltransferase